MWWISRGNLCNDYTNEIQYTSLQRPRAKIILLFAEIKICSRAKSAIVIVCICGSQTAIFFVKSKDGRLEIYFSNYFGIKPIYVSYVFDLVSHKHQINETKNRFNLGNKSLLKSNMMETEVLGGKPSTNLQKIA